MTLSFEPALVATYILEENPGSNRMDEIARTIGSLDGAASSNGAQTRGDHIDRRELGS